MNDRIARHDAGVLDADISSSEIRHEPSRFTDEQSACGDIPGREALLPEAVEAARRNVYQIESGCTRPADSAGALSDESELPLVFLET